MPLLCSIPPPPSFCTGTEFRVPMGVIEVHFLPTTPAPILVLPLNQFFLLLLALLAVIWKETQQATTSGPWLWYHVWLAGPKAHCFAPFRSAENLLPRALSYKQHICKPRHTLFSPPHPILQSYYQPGRDHLLAQCRPHYTVSSTTVGLSWFCALLQSTWGLWQV